MKKIVRFLIPVTLFFTACGGAGEDKPGNATSAEVPEGMAPVDLSKEGLPVVINAPDSTSGKLMVESHPTGAVSIKIGKNFQVLVQEADGELIDMTLQKSFIQGDDVNKFQKFIVEEPAAILYESLITVPEYHLYVIQKIGNVSYVIKDNPEEKFSKEAAQKMFDAAKNLRVK